MSTKSSGLLDLGDSDGSGPQYSDQSGFPDSTGMMANPAFPADTSGSPTSQTSQPAATADQAAASPPQDLAALAKAVADAFAPPDSSSQPAGGPIPIGDPVQALITIANTVQAQGGFVSGSSNAGGTGSAPPPPPEGGPGLSTASLPPPEIVAAFLMALQDPKLATMFLDADSSGNGMTASAPASGPDLPPPPGLSAFFQLHDPAPGGGSAGTLLPLADR